MTFYPTDKIALFIDGANFFSAGRALNTDIDYKKLLEEFRKRGILIRAYYYTAIAEDDDWQPLHRKIEAIRHMGGAHANSS